MACHLHRTTLHRFVRALPFLFASACCLLLATACRERSETPQAEIPPAVAPLRLGIGSMITPKEGYIFYQQLGQYLSRRLDRQVEIVDRGTYEAFNLLLQEGNLDVAFVCGGPYVEGKEQFDLQLLVKPETLTGETVYYSLLLVAADSTARSLDDLRGKSFAFTDPKSNTGYIVPTALLVREGKRPETFFGEITYTYAHDRSIRAVAEGVVDAAAVDSLIYDFLVHSEPALKNRLRILLRSQPYGIPPVVVPPGLPAELRDRLRDTLLAMDQNEEGRKILEGMLLRRFVPARDDDYRSIRQDLALIRQAYQP